MNLIDFQFIAQNFSFILYLAIITLTLTVILKSTKIFIAQLAMLVALSMLHEMMILVIPVSVISIQILLSITVLYRLHKAIHRNYLLILEKTHQIRPELTKRGNGSERSFF